MKKKMDQTKALDRNRGKGIEGSDGTLAEQKFGENDRKEREQWIQLFPVESRRGERISWLRQDLQAAGDCSNQVEEEKRALQKVSTRLGGRLPAGGIVDVSRPHQKPWQARIDEHKRKQKLQFKGLAFLRKSRENQLRELQNSVSSF